uniref:Uncharacterized protein n=1 Tax=Ciona savignyi TaxID=51511 RepID=H2YIP2_CIOSA
IISVAVISLLSVIGILIVPLMRHSGFFNRLISFLVALAVGTLTGDALLHLLPHAMGDHDHGSGGHEGHNHGDESKEKEKLMKSLAAHKVLSKLFNFLLFKFIQNVLRFQIFGKYFLFFVFFILKLSPIFIFQCILTFQESKKKSADVVKTSPSDSSVGSPIRSHKNGDHTHRHSHTHTHHNHEELLNSEGIKDLAWMIIMGDGLHNFSDGLAIGAAFSSSIAAGLGTSLAVFCHELPHELGDFAILLQAGMSIKKAVLYNGLSACMAFIGVIIGLLIGEYTTSVKLWLLAVTAGGFLYVALVDMVSGVLTMFRNHSL